jgi:hypothetical protein
MKSRIATSAIMAALVVGLCLTGCEQGPAEKAGKKIDKAVDDIKK